MTLKNISIAAFVAIIFLFLNRIAGTIHFPIYTSSVLVYTKITLNFLAYLTIILFFLKFTRDFVPGDEYCLINASVSVTIGCLALLIINFLNNLSPFLPHAVHQSISGQYLSNIIVWIFSFLITIFCLYLYLFLLKEEEKELITSTRLVLFGNVLGFLLRSINLLNFFYYYQNNQIFINLQQDAVAAIGSVIILFIFITRINFLIRFYKSLD